MAPEQLLRKALDHRADIFAYGVAAYELLTRKRGRSPARRAKRFCAKQLDRTFTLTAAAPAKTRTSRPRWRSHPQCLERDPNKRYPWMSVLLRDLKAAPDPPCPHPANNPTAPTVEHRRAAGDHRRADRGWVVMWASGLFEHMGARPPSWCSQWTWWCWRCCGRCCCDAT